MSKIRTIAAVAALAASTLTIGLGGTTVAHADAPTTASAPTGRLNTTPAAGRLDGRLVSVQAANGFFNHGRNSSLSKGPLYVKNSKGKVTKVKANSYIPTGSKYIRVDKGWQGKDRSMGYTLTARWHKIGFLNGQWVVTRIPPTRR